MKSSDDTASEPPPVPVEQELTPGARRILESASELFYWRGITAVGVDTIAAESGVTKRTLYDQFGSKDGLVLAYLQAQNRTWRDRVSSRVQAAPRGTAERILAVFDVLPDWLAGSGRGSTFVNAFAELPDPDHPGHQVTVATKQWLRELLGELATEAGAQTPDELACQLFCLHEGAVVSYAITHDADAVPAARAAAAALLDQCLGETPD